MSNHPALARAMELIRLGVFSVDDLGRIWRHKAFWGGQWKDIVARRAENDPGKGYLRITLQVDGRKTLSVMAHVVVWVDANGPIPEGIQVNHKDLVKDHNWLGNLELMTGSENIRHSYANGRTRPWSFATEWRGMPVSSPAQREEIRSLRKSGMTLKNIGDRFNLGTSQVSRICAPHAEGGRNGPFAQGPVSLVSAARVEPLP